MHAKGYCAGCYNSVFHLKRTKEHNAKRYHNIKPELYRELIKKCTICGFDKIIEIHHLDDDHKNNSPDNVIGICPTHHKMIHHRSFRKEILQILKEKGYKSPKTYKDDIYFKEATIHGLQMESS